MTTNPKPKESILRIQPYKAGKSSASGAQRIIKLSSNENPLGASPKAIEAYKQAADQLYRYPDSSHTELKEAIASVYNLPAGQIICGAGSDELIGLIIQAYTSPGDEVLYPEHSFLMYKIYSLAHGAVPKTAPEKDYRTDVDALIKAVTDKTKIVFIANPNNPTGSYITKDELHHLRKELPDHILLVIDNAYTEYVENEDYSTGEELVGESCNTVMLRTFSKIYGLPALRLGWGYCPTEVIDILNRVRGPFNVNSPAIAAGIAAVKDVSYTSYIRDYNNRELKRVSEALSQHYTVYPSIGNFVMVGFGEPARATAANHYLTERGIIVREIAAYGLAECLRISIGTEEENNAVIEALEGFIKQ